MTVCRTSRPSCGHAARVDDWREIWQAWESRREQENPGMYARELRDWDDANPPVTFRDYLRGMRRSA